ncbi:MAG: hypothetical protein UHK60_06530 [Acutalibacteraceae bacterium]|nr:hypothetical protein [Acutalibacteraceae bacterium]
MFNYSICNQPDEEIFEKQCKALEKHIPNIVKGQLLMDVDYSKTQIYTVDQKRITVHNSYYIGAVYINAEIELEQYFK